MSLQQIIRNRKNGHPETYARTVAHPFRQTKFSSRKHNIAYCWPKQPNVRRDQPTTTSFERQARVKDNFLLRFIFFPKTNIYNNKILTAEKFFNKAIIKRGQCNLTSTAWAEVNIRRHEVLLSGVSAAALRFGFDAITLIYWCQAIRQFPQIITKRFT